MPEVQFCHSNHLNSRTLSAIEDLKLQLITCVVDAGLLPLSQAEKVALSRYFICHVSLLLDIKYLILGLDLVTSSAARTFLLSHPLSTPLQITIIL